MLCPESGLPFVSRVSLNLIFVGTNAWKLEEPAATRKISASSSNLRKAYLFPCQGGG
jgi:hypothetical protein